MLPYTFLCWDLKEEYVGKAVKNDVSSRYIVVGWKRYCAICRMKQEKLVSSSSRKKTRNILYLFHQSKFQTKQTFSFKKKPFLICLHFPPPVFINSTWPSNRRHHCMKWWKQQCFLKKIFGVQWVLIPRKAAKSGIVTLFMISSNLCRILNILLA